MSKIHYNERVDICDIQIDMDAPLEIRAVQYIEQIKNPYAFRCGDLAVNISFTEDGKTLKNALISYLTAIKKS